MQMNSLSLEKRTRFGPLRNIDAALLRTFIAVVDTGTLQQASDQVCRTQAAVSQQLKRLEELVGIVLFSKSGRRLQLTPAGERFLASARQFMAAHDAMFVPLSHFANEQELHGPMYGSALPQKFDCGDGPQFGRVTTSPSRNGGPQAATSVLKFEDHVKDSVQMAVLAAWRELSAGVGCISIDRLEAVGLISRDSSMCILNIVEDSSIRLVDLSVPEMRDYGVRSGDLGGRLENYIDNADIVEARRKMFLTCHHANVPVFYSGNATMPSDSPIVAESPEYMTTKLDRLALPVMVEAPGRKNLKGVGGVLIVGAWDPTTTYAWLLEREDDQARNHVRINVTEPPVFGF